MSEPDDKAWFGKKRIGWGYGPRRWQGWLVCVLVVVGIVLIARLRR